MSEPTTIEPKEPAAPTTQTQTGAVAAAGATAAAVNQNTITVNVRLEAPHRAAGSGSPRRSAPSSGGTAARSAPSGINNGGSVMSNATGAVANPLERDYPGLEESSYRSVGGNVVRIFRDGNNGTISITRNRGTGEYEITLRDLNGSITTHSNTAGFDGHRYAGRGFDGGDRQTMRAVPSWGGSEQYGLRGHVYCEASDGWLTTGQVAASDRVVGDVTADQIREFAHRHPQLRQMLRDSDIPLTSRGGQSVTLEQIEAAGAPRSRACPASSPDTIVQRLP